MSGCTESKTKKGTVVRPNSVVQNPTSEYLKKFPDLTSFLKIEDFVESASKSIIKTACLSDPNVSLKKR
jgi:hypothetical protein